MKIPEKIEVGVYYYKERSGKIIFDFELMADEYYRKVTNLNLSINGLG